MIGLDDGNISLVILQEQKYSIPLSSLDFDIANVESDLFKIIFLASKIAFSKDLYANIKINKVSFDDLPQNIENLIKINIYI